MAVEVAGNVSCHCVGSRFTQNSGMVILVMLEYHSFAVQTGFQR